jgi:hypothetical protein
VTNPASIPDLLARIRTELPADFDPSQTLRLGHCTTPDGSAAVAIQSRNDRQVHLFSFNEYDRHLPFTLRIPIDALAQSPVDLLQRELSAPGRQWAAPLIGTLRTMHDSNQFNLLATPGLTLALLHTIAPYSNPAIFDAVATATRNALAA